MAVEGHRAVDEIDEASVIVDDPAGESDDVVVCSREPVDEGFEPALLGQGVVVEKDERFSVGNLGSGRDAAGESAILRETDQAHAIAAADDLLAGSVGRSIVDHRHANAGHLTRSAADLGESRVQGAQRVVAAVPADDDDVGDGAAHARLLRRRRILSSTLGRDDDTAAAGPCVE